MKTGKKILAVMMMAAFMLVANAVLVPAVASARVLLRPPPNQTVDGKMSLAEQIQTALKSGKSLQSVMEEAMKDGKDIYAIVAAAIKAGVKADDAVYVAIKADPKGVQSILRAAVDTGAKPESIAAAAKAAGIEKVAVKKIFDINNVDNDKKAQALKVFDDTIFAYTPPADNTSRSTDQAGETSKTNTFTRTFTYTVNNSGGSTPSTQTASPIL